MRDEWGPDDDELLVDDRSTSMVLAGPGRASPADLRGHPLHVEPVLLQVGDELLKREDVGAELRLGLLARYGFAPREIHVERGAQAMSSWVLVVDGEPVDCGDLDDDLASIRSALERNLYRMLGTDDVLELLAFAQLESPMAIERTVPHRVSIELLRGVLQRLLREFVTIKPLAKIVETLGTAGSTSGDLELLVDRVRLARRRTIVSGCAQADGKVQVIQLAQEGAASCDAVGEAEDDRRSRLRNHLSIQLVAVAGELRPVVIVAPREHRRAVVELLRTTNPDVRVLGSNEVAGLDVDVVSTIGTGIHVASSLKPPPTRFQGRVVVDESEYLQNVMYPLDGEDDIADVEVID